MPHAAAGRRGPPRNKPDNRFLHVFLDVGGGLLFFRGPADFADHDDRVGLRVSIEELDRIDKPRPDYGIPADADAR